LACFALVVLATGAVPPGTNVVIPVEYRGEWTNEPRFCNFAGDDLDSVLTVSAGWVGYFEENWKVRSVRRVAGGLKVTYYPRKDFNIYAPNFLRLSKDRQRMFTSSDPKDTGYKRCPKAGN
jgi:hypothetical protein